MYAYRKAMPRLNKHLDDKWVKHCQQMHRKRLKQMKAAIDNKPPPKYVHLVQNLKKQQMDEERYSQIERDNYLLLDKMSEKIEITNQGWEDGAGNDISRRLQEHKMGMGP